jgi:hypothetical protein
LSFRYRSLVQSQNQQFSDLHSHQAIYYLVLNLYERYLNGFICTQPIDLSHSLQQLFEKYKRFHFRYLWLLNLFFECSTTAKLYEYV